MKLIESFFSPAMKGGEEEVFYVQYEVFKLEAFFLLPLGL